MRSLVKGLQLHQLPSYQEIVATKADEYTWDKTFAEAENDPILICHTSGSTGAPKPITLTNGNWAVVDNLRKIPKLPGRKNQDWSLFSFEDRDFFISSFPPFHATGMIAGMLPLMYNSICVFPPPDRPATGAICLGMLECLHRLSLRVRGILVPPTVVEQLILEEDNGLEHCSRLDFVMFTGGPLAPSVGDRLSQYADICQLIGSTETGPIPGLVPRREDWAYFEWQPFYKIDMEPRMDNDFELTIRQDPELRWIRTVAHTMPDQPLWYSSDLYRRHPEKPELWRFHGRADDVVVLSNGEKFNPVPMEAIIQGHPLVNGAVYYGQEPKSEVHDNYLGVFIDQVWPIVEKANLEAPQHAQIFRDKIAISSLTKPLTRAAKGTIVRKITLKDYFSELEALYSDPPELQLEQLQPLDVPVNIDSLRGVVRQALSGLTQIPMSDTEDLFSLGMDSLQTLQLVKRLNARFGLQMGRHTVNAKQVYAHPTVESLSKYIIGLSQTKQNGHEDGQDVTTRREAIMTSLIHKYTKNWRRPQRSCHTVVLTGTTGSLGTHLLLSLLLAKSVDRIYCLNRTEDAKERQQRAFENVQANQHVNDPRLRFWKVDLAQAKFGLEEDSFDELLQETDCIIHNAWKVDFNHNVKSFQGVIAGLCRLVDFAKLSHRQPHFVFVSSVSSVGNWSTIMGNESPVPESPMTDCAVAQHQGYGESKHVSEQILQIAAKEFNLRASILRVGQVAGPVRRGGCWNKTEWFPSLIQTSKALRMIPEALPEVNWIPVDTLADIVVDIIHSPVVESPAIFNLVNPKPVSWASLVPTVQSRFGAGKLIAVSLHEWITAVRSVDMGDPDAVNAAPAAKIVDFFEAIAGTNARSPRYTTSMGPAISKTMGDLGPVNPGWMDIWLTQWNF
ncbi:hypothetical protein LTS07_008301 [Exophiala sideris]|uniref:Carrier domain-containing protein n=1 Tax=Exophiala sideris TaxID=1016849 RepID=A0ABR0J2X8_9EURO|nr:hypothetical protein LTS07_008301 [Exophiala sideris]KAK5054962.1 hypothetical protein LTR69_008530 [Exophiala sideris]KAK5179842.1 putative secondary metabolism biosynthetic enzyme [Eurotiomycetes sp. CCFEE 6388]